MLYLLVFVVAAVVVVDDFFVFYHKWALMQSSVNNKAHIIFTLTTFLNLNHPFQHRVCIVSLGQLRFSTSTRKIKSMSCLSHLCVCVCHCWCGVVDH